MPRLPNPQVTTTRLALELWLLRNAAPTQAPVQTPTETPTKAPTKAPDPVAPRREQPMQPERLCPDQKKEITRKLEPLFPS